MRVHILAGTLFLLLGVDAAFAQAAAESVLLNGSAATAAAKAGTVLGNNLNKAGSKTAGQLQTVPKSRVVVHPSKPATHSTNRPTAPTAPAAPTVANRAPMVTSIQGGRVTHSSAAHTPPADGRPADK